RLIEQEEPGAGTEDAPDGQHLLLATRELGALTPQPLPEVREQVEDRVEGEPARPYLRRQEQVLLHVEAGEDPALLGTERESEPREAVRWRADQLRALEPDGPQAP